MSTRNSVGSPSWASSSSRKTARVSALSCGSANSSLTSRSIQRLATRLLPRRDIPPEDTPEFAVHIFRSLVDRPAYSAAATRIFQPKNLQPTRETDSVLHALAGSPYTAAQALQQLAGETEHRELRPDELRYALGTLEPKQLLSDLSPAVGRIVHTLLTAESRLSQCELADQADVSPRMVRNYQDRLEALDLIRADESGYRLALSFQTATERRDSVIPAALEENQILLDIVDSLFEMFLPPDRYGDPNDPLGSALLATGSVVITQSSNYWSLASGCCCAHTDRLPWEQAGPQVRLTAQAAIALSYNFVAVGSRSISNLPPHSVNQHDLVYCPCLLVNQVIS
ncbi:hypothetical protein Natoc_1278 [Natronococcus occultus SP4]|uniref:Uncharacterized protein n=1 Tax=Natronococcus occultus SP4 TaxID=694430 RepID=L0JVP0_9EURY|nr:hypothetical protein Natoc_1278 [Natronococcus occultus SP4]